MTAAPGGGALRRVARGQGSYVGGALVAATSLALDAVPRYAAATALFALAAVGGVRWARKRMRRRPRVSLDPFGNPIDVEIARTSQPS